MYHAAGFVHIIQRWLQGRAPASEKSLQRLKPFVS
jgi:hypothetical protein